LILFIVIITKKKGWWLILFMALAVTSTDFISSNGYKEYKIPVSLKAM